jgi:hypothetical protein
VIARVSLDHKELQYVPVFAPYIHQAGASLGSQIFGQQAKNSIVATLDRPKYTGNLAENTQSSTLLFICDTNISLFFKD